MATPCGIVDGVRKIKEAEANALLGIPTNFDPTGDSKMHIMEVKTKAGVRADADSIRTSRKLSLLYRDVLKKYTKKL